MNRTLVPLVLSALLVLVAAGPAAADQAAAAAYLDRAMPGGCHVDRGAPNLTFTAWAVIGLEAAGRSGHAGVGCLERHGDRLRGAAELELTILAVVATGRNPRAFAGRNVVAELLRLRRGGSFGGATALTLFGVLALRAAGEPVPAPVLAAVRRSQRRDGSFGVAPGAAGSADMTAAGIQALRAMGLPARSAPVRRALAALARYRNADGGYGDGRTAPSNSQSTAWAVQALAACGRPTVGGRRYLLRLQGRDGSIRYSRSAAPTPFWVTAQALAALAGRPLPVRG
jgi:hypothetical protein